MKHPKPDIGDSLRTEFISNVSTVRKLLKNWGTTSVDGVSVLHQRKYYYPKSNAIANEKLFRMLNMYEDVTRTKMEGIDSAWIYFNKNKEETTAYSVATTDFVLHNLNLAWWDLADGARPDGLTLTTSIVIEGLFQASNTRSSEEYVETTPLLDFKWTTAQLISALGSNYDAIWDTALVSQQGVGVINKGSITAPVTKIVTPDEDDLSQNDPWLATIARYALRTNGIPYTIKDVEVGIARVESGRIYPTYVVTIELPFTVFTSGMGIVTDIVTDITNNKYISLNLNKLTYPNWYYTRQAIRSLSSTDLETDNTVVTRPYMPWDDAAYGNYEALWYSTGGIFGTISSVATIFSYFREKKYYIRAGALENPRAYGLTYKELNNYLLPLLDSDYKKKKVKWWKKLIAVVVFVVAVVFAPVTGGGSLALAKGILFAILVITAISLVAAQLGMTDWALAFAEVNKMVEPIAFIATIVLIFTGISAAINAAKEAAAKAAGKAVADVTLKEVLRELVLSSADGMIDEIIQGATELFSGQITGASMAFLQKIGDLVTRFQRMQLESINDRNKDLSAEYEKLTEDAELEMDVLRGFANIYASPATADWSMYAGLFDLPYEGTGGPLHTGNTQRTTKQALRKAKYDDPVFNDILII